MKEIFDLGGMENKNKQDNNVFFYINLIFRKMIQIILQIKTEKIKIVI